VNHDEAWTRLPDLLDDRDDPGLLAHVRGCADCQRQLFLLGRVERVLHRRAETRRPRRALRRRYLAAAAAVATVTAAAVLTLTLPSHDRHTNAFTLRTAAGRPVAEAMLGQSGARNVSLELVAQRLPLNRRHVFVLWAADDRASMEVGDFMVDATGGCRVSFNLPATHEWIRFWVAQPGNAAAVVAST
jgi:hypothetical protein